MNKNLKNDSYKSLLEELKSIISNGQHRAYKAVDNIKVQTYWQIGERVVREEMNNKLYQNTDQKEIISLQKNITPATTDIQKLFKPEYNLNFLSISKNYQVFSQQQTICLRTRCYWFNYLQ